MGLDQRLVDAAIALLEQRFPTEGGIAAAMATDDGQIFTGVSFQPEWGGGGLCAETGPICEAAKLNVRITASVCVSRLSGDGQIIILTPCGICQERLFHWGGSIEVAVPDPERVSGWRARTLDQIQPYYWVNVYTRASS
jgi:cytidine deaminase